MYIGNRLVNDVDIASLVFENARYFDLGKQDPLFNHPTFEIVRFRDLHDPVISHNKGLESITEEESFGNADPAYRNKAPFKTV